MNLSEIKQILKGLNPITFQLPNNSFIPEHFHITELGIITKNFIDCGGTVREEKVVSLQLWEANDFDHRLSSEKLLNIIEIAEKVLQIDPTLDIEIEYQRDSISKYGLSYNGSNFQLTSKSTACLAQDACGIPIEKQKVKLADLGSAAASSCKPGGSCC